MSKPATTQNTDPQTPGSWGAVSAARQTAARPLVALWVLSAIAFGPAWLAAQEQNPTEQAEEATAAPEQVIEQAEEVAEDESVTETIQESSPGDRTPPLAEGSPQTDEAPPTTALTYATLEPRKLAEGVLKVVPPPQSAGDMTIGPIDLPFVAEHPELEWSPPTFPEGKPNTFSASETLLELGRDVTLRHPVWGLEFAFKPVRLIQAPVATPTGVEDKLVWYMVYRVRYVGGDLLPQQTAVEAGTGLPTDPKRVIYDSVRFLPRFTLVSTEFDESYPAQILSTAKGPIANRERIGKPLLDYMEMTSTAIEPVSEEADNSVWGIATWTDVNPQIDAFHVDVGGLTNAFRLETDGEGNRTYQRKTLRIYFWKPGDSIDPRQDRIEIGVPAFESLTRQAEILELFRLDEPIDYLWIYR